MSVGLLIVLTGPVEGVWSGWVGVLCDAYSTNLSNSFCCLYICKCYNHKYLWGLFYSLVHIE